MHKALENTAVEYKDRDKSSLTSVSKFFVIPVTSKLDGMVCLVFCNELVRLLHRVNKTKMIAIFVCALWLRKSPRISRQMVKSTYSTAISRNFNITPRRGHLTLCYKVQFTQVSDGNIRWSYLHTVASCLRLHTEYQGLLEIPWSSKC